MLKINQCNSTHRFNKNMLAYNTREQEQDLDKIYLLLNFKLVLRLR